METFSPAKSLPIKEFFPYPGKFQPLFKKIVTNKSTRPLIQPGAVC